MIQSAPQFQQLKLFRITSDQPTTTTTSTTSTSSTSSTTSTTSTTTTTTTPPPCWARIWRGIAVDVQFNDSLTDPFGYRPVVTIERLQEVVPMLASFSLALSIHDIVLAGQINGQWWVLQKYFNCPQSAITTTTTTTTTTTSTTTPQPANR